MRALTVRQPWAWAIVHGGKRIENRRQFWKYRGPLMIHAGTQLSEEGCMDLPGLIDDADPSGTLIRDYAVEDLDRGAVIGMAQLVDAHMCRDLEDEPCCQPWGQHEHTEITMLGQAERTYMPLIAHLVLADVVPLRYAVPAKGKLGLWIPDADLISAVEAAA